MTPLALLVATAAGQLSANYAYNYTSYATSLRQQLLQNYDMAVPPTSQRSSGFSPYSEAGTDVSVQMRFFKVMSVSTSEGKMMLRVWLRLAWTDTRLSWDPSQHGGITSVKFFASSFSNREDTEIWLPDATVYNSVHGLMSSFEPAMARASSDGTIFWSRQGSLEVLCRFSGLVMFPFDELSCPIDLGGWIAGAGTQGIISNENGCAAIDGSEEVSRTTYSDLELLKVDCEVITYTYACCPNDPYPVIKYRVYVRRIPGYYLLWTLVPSTVFTLLSFSVFFMSFQVGERLGVGVTLVLTIEISRGALQEVVPICGELLWLETVFLLNLFFTVLSLIESAIVLGLAFATTETLLPQPITNLLKMCGRRSRSRVGDLGGGEVAAAFKQYALQGESLAGFLLRSPTVIGGGAVNTAATVAEEFSTLVGKGVQGAVQGIVRSVTTEVATSSPRPAAEVDGGGKDHAASVDASKAAAGPASAPPSPPSPPSPSSEHEETAASKASTSSKLIFFENLFFNLDVDGGGTITFDELRRMLAFLALDLSTEEREAALRRADSQPDGKLTRFEFMDFCVSVLWHQPLQQMKEASDAYAGYRVALLKRANTRWRSRADNIDRVARFWMPTLYVMAWVCLYNLRLDDDYRGQTAEAVRREANGTTSDGRGWTGGEVQTVFNAGHGPGGRNTSTELFTPMSGYWQAMRFVHGSLFDSLGIQLTFTVLICAAVLWLWVRWKQRWLQAEALRRSQFLGRTEGEVRRQEALIRSRTRAAHRSLMQMRMSAATRKAKLRNTLSFGGKKSRVGGGYAKQTTPPLQSVQEEESAVVQELKSPCDERPRAAPVRLTPVRRTRLPEASCSSEE